MASSLTLGLHRAGLEIRRDPSRARISEHIGVLSHVDTLRHAIGQRRERRARWLIAGPNVVVAPERSGRVLTAPEIDRVVVPSAWVRDMFLSRAPELRDRITIWPAGVDEEMWSPAARALAPIADVLIYAKSGPPDLLADCCRALAGAGLRYTILRYGSYGALEYRASLRAHRWMLFLSESETQGLALFEAWACDVPTLVWDRGRCVFEDIDWRGASSAPYLAPANGRSFREPSEVAAAIADMENSTFAPRQFVLEGFTALQTARQYARLFPPFGDIGS